ncbi:MAG: hypothetical protein JNM17_36250 [Archangium sp.]|nr:hypothetical protein [Archangium sp.]
MTFCACVKEVPVVSKAPEPVDAGLSEADLILPKVDAIEREVIDVLRVNDEALWKSWTTGAPLDLPANAKGHEALLGKNTLDVLRRARELRPKDTERIDALSRWITGEALVRGVATETEAITSLEASATFLVDGKEFAWRDLGKTLLSERSAVKRRSIWVASHEVALKLDALIARRDQKATEVLASLGEPGPLEYAARSRGFELAQLEKRAEDALAASDEEWKATLQALSDLDVKLPAVQLTRGDFPRLLKVPAAIDAEFPKAKVATRLIQTLGALGEYGKPGLTLDLAEAAKKNPLPLTVAPASNDVRVSIRPLGGLRDQQLALAEVGAALQLKKMAAEPVFRGRLASPLAAQTESERFAALLTDGSWLSANEVKDTAAVIKSVKAQRLFMLRRAAGLVLARLAASRAADEAAARSAFVTVMTLAMGVTLSAEEGARWRVETDDFLRSATLLEAMLAAQASPLTLPAPASAQ